MMTQQDIRAALKSLEISQTEAALLLGVNPRTVRRWVEGSQGVSGTAEQALRAWLRLNEEGLTWRPDSISIAEFSRQSIAAHRRLAIELNALLSRVKARGGPSVPWVVNLEKSTATLGPLRVSFYKLQNGGFSPQTYTRTDKNPDLQRDADLLDDAYYCIAKAFKKQQLS